ncbi:MAG: hypothetical protein DRN88_05810, partial [Candidatus Hydrothermarchaeota archaeon]
MECFGLDIHNPSNISDFINFVDTSNKVKGKPIYYWINEKDKEIPKNAGYVALVNCTNVTVKDLALSGNEQGVLLAYTKNSEIENVNASNNYDAGIQLYYSSNNTILSNNFSEQFSCGIVLVNSSHNKVVNNTANSNNWDGIYLSHSSNNTIYNNNASNNVYGITLWDSSNNTIYLNNFINNRYNIYSHSSTNIWNSTEKITYTYNGNTYTNYLGN